MMFEENKVLLMHGFTRVFLCLLRFEYLYLVQHRGLFVFYEE